MLSKHIDNLVKAKKNFAHPENYVALLLFRELDNGAHRVIDLGVYVHAHVAMQPASG